MNVAQRMQNMNRIRATIGTHNLLQSQNNAPIVAALMAALAVPPAPPAKNNDALIASIMAIQQPPEQPPLKNNNDALLSAILAAMAKEPEREEEKKEEEKEEKEEKKEEMFNRQIDCLGESNDPNKIGCVKNNN